VNFVIEKTIKEIEWNNKDPFFDRDLENFKRLHAEGGISLGVIVTRGASLQCEMRDLVKRFAEEKPLATSDDLVSVGLNPTPRQKKTVADRVQRGVMFADASSSALWLTNMGLRRPLEQVGGSGSAGRRKSVSACTDRPTSSSPLANRQR
jgi:Restriction endonuclease BglII